MSKDSSSTQSLSLGNPILAIVIATVVFLASQVIAGVLVLMILALMHGGQPVDSLLENSNAGQFLLILIAESLAVATVFVLSRGRGISLSKIGLGRRPVADDLLKAVIGFVFFWLILIAANLALSLLAPGLDTNQKQDLGFTNLHSSPDKILAFLALVILPPLGEEPLVRGYLYGALRERWKFVPSMVATSLVFGIAHLEFGSGNPLVWGAALNTFVLSIVLVYLRERSGALYAGIVVHMLNNLLAFVVYLH